MFGKLAFSGTNAGTPSFDFSVESQKNKSVIGGSARPQWMKNLAASVTEWLAIIPKVTSWQFFLQFHEILIKMQLWNARFLLVWFLVRTEGNKLSHTHSSHTKPLRKASHCLHCTTPLLSVVTTQHDPVVDYLSNFLLLSFLAVCQLDLVLVLVTCTEELSLHVPWTLGCVIQL